MAGRPRHVACGGAGGGPSCASSYNRSMPWPASVERVSAFLRAAAAESRLEELPVDTPTAQAAADAIGCTLDQIVKSLVLLCDGDRSWRSSPATGGATSRRSAARPARPRRASRVPHEVEAATGFAPGTASRPSRCRGVERVLIERTLLAHPCRLGRGRLDATSSGSRRESSYGCRAQNRWTSSRSPHTIRSRTRTGRSPEQMQETEKIWMNGELVDWADAKVHVGVHGLHYGTGVFEGIRCYDTPKGPAVFRLADHLQRLHDSARLLYMEIPYSVERAARSHARARVGRTGCRPLHPPDRVLRLRRARRLDRGQPGRDRDHELAVGRLSRRGLAGQRHHRQDLLLEAGRRRT